jgi:hypothetical protein
MSHKILGLNLKMVHMVFMFIKILLIFYKVTKLVIGVSGFIRFSHFLYLLSGWQYMSLSSFQSQY